MNRLILILILAVATTRIIIKVFSICKNLFHYFNLFLVILFERCIWAIIGFNNGRINIQFFITQFRILVCLLFELVKWLLIEFLNRFWSIIEFLNLWIVSRHIKTSFCVTFSESLFCFIWLDLALLWITHLIINPLLICDFFINRWFGTRWKGNDCSSFLVVWCFEIHSGKFTATLLVVGNHDFNILFAC